MKKEADFDTTYCVNENCSEKCWRYKDNWKFSENKNYWYMEKCDKGGSKMKLEDILKETAEVKKFRSIQDEMMESVLKEK